MRKRNMLNSSYLVKTPQRTFRVQPSATPNPIAWTGDNNTQFGRVIVGFNVGRRPTWNIDDLEREWHEFAQERNFPRGVTIVPQRGAFVDDETGDVIQEDGATLTVLNIMDKVPRGTFAKFMQRFGEHLAEAFRQKEVIVQIGTGSTATDTWGVRPYTDDEIRRIAQRRGLSLPERTAKPASKIRRW